MRLLLVGTDRAIFQSGSAVGERIARFGDTHTDSLESVVFSTRNHGISSPKQLGGHVWAHPTNSRSRFLYIFDGLRVARALKRPDIVSAQDPFETGLAAYFIARYFRVPFMIEAHTDFLSPSFARHSFLNRARLLIARFVLSRAAGGYAVSERIRNSIAAAFPKSPKLGVFPIYVDTKRFAHTAHVQHPNFKMPLVWIGRLEREKNPALALEAFAAARKQGHDVGLTYVGNGSLEPGLKKMASALRVEKYVEFVGFAPDVLPYLARADLMLVTSRYEGYGMAIVEALASGVPVLSTDVGIAREAGAVIAGDDYAKSLGDWLSGDKARGVLKLRQYENEDDYFAQVAAHYQAAAKHI